MHYKYEYLHVKGLLRRTFFTAGNAGDRKHQLWITACVLIGMEIVQSGLLLGFEDLPPYLWATMNSIGWKRCQSNETVRSDWSEGETFQNEGMIVHLIHILDIVRYYWMTGENLSPYECASLLESVICFMLLLWWYSKFQK